MRGDGEPAERLYGKGGGDGRGMDVLLKWLWGWQGLMQREGKPTPLRKESGIVQMRNRISTHIRSPYEK